MKRLIIDLNADVAERPEALADGTEEKIISLISSANIACGGHAGDEVTMAKVLRLCAKYGVAAGAHPGYPDRQNFGRLEMRMSLREIEESVYGQVMALARIANENGIELRHVKPHGALYNVAARNRDVAAAVARGVASCNRDLILVGLAGSAMLQVWQEMGFRVAPEAFADRAYESNGELRSRAKPDALITDPEGALRQAMTIIREQKVISIDGVAVPLHAKTICVHSDTPNAAEILFTLRTQLAEAGIVISSLR
jgi:UPF0271 protein